MKETESDLYGGEDTSAPNLPAAVVQPDDEDDDGIFLSWPGRIPADDADPLSDPDDDGEDAGDSGPDDSAAADSDEEEDDEDDGFPSIRSRQKKRAEKKQKRGKNKRRFASDEPQTDQFAFRQAAESDLEESSGHRRPKKKEEDNEAALSSMKYYRHTAKLRGVMLRRVLPPVLALVFIVGFLLYFFRLQHLTFDNLTGYPAEEVFRASGLKKNMFVFSVSESDIKRRLRTKFPYIEDIEVERELPDTVHILFTEDCARFYTQMYDEYFVISQSLRVLARCDSEDELPSGLRKLRLPAVSYAVVGHDLRFFDVSYADFLADIMSIFEDAVVYDKIGELDLSNRYDLSFRYDNRLEFDIGTAENLNTKLLYVKSLVEELKTDEHGSFTLIGNKMATYSADAPSVGN